MTNQMRAARLRELRRRRPDCRQRLVLVERALCLLWLALAAAAARVWGQR